MGFMDGLKKLTQPYDDDEDFFEGADQSLRPQPKPEQKAAVSAAQMAFENAFADPGGTPAPAEEAQPKKPAEGGTGGIFGGFKKAAQSASKPRRERTVNFGGRDTSVLLFSPKNFDEAGELVSYLQQDMRNFELYGTVRAIYSTCDSINYLTKEKDLVKVLKLVNNYLDPKGIFVFDLKTVHFYRDVMANTVEAQNLDECSYIWKNYYDAGRHLNEYDLTLFIREKDVYRKSEEIHLQRAYTLAEVKKAIQSAGMVFVKAFDEKDGGKVRPGTERMIIVAREKGK